MSQQAQTSAEERRRRPLLQYVITRGVGPGGDRFRVECSNAGTKPSHWLIDPPHLLDICLTLEEARMIVPEGFKRMNRRKDDPTNLVEVWV